MVLPLCPNPCLPTELAALELLDAPVFGVQYHPEASPGPHDADHHFARFAALMASRR